MSIYLDASVIVGLFIETDALAERAHAIVFNDDEVLIVSDFAVAEFASAVSRLARTSQITVGEAREVFETFDRWRADLTDSEETDPADIRAANALIRRLDLNIRTPDAINLAIALRLAASVATFDQRMAESARILGIAVATI